MVLERENRPHLAEVWGDTVVLRELLLASILGIVLTMSGYLIGRYIFGQMPNIEEGLAKGYSLMIGIIGCVVSAIISANLFKPKRVVEEQFEVDNIEEIIKFGGMTLEEEIEALQNVDPQVLREMEELNLKGLLQLKDAKR